MERPSRSTPRQPPQGEIKGGKFFTNSEGERSAFEPKQSVRPPKSCGRNQQLRIIRQSAYQRASEQGPMI